jgi:hypothetical protein
MELSDASTSCTGLQLNSFWIFKAYLLSHPDLLFACSELLFSCRLRAVSVTICSGQILTCLYRTPFIELHLNLLPCRIYITSRHHLPHFCYFLGSLLILLRSILSLRVERQSPLLSFSQVEAVHQNKCSSWLRCRA